MTEKEMLRTKKISEWVYCDEFMFGKTPRGVFLQAYIFPLNKPKIIKINSSTAMI